MKKLTHILIVSTLTLFLGNASSTLGDDRVAAREGEGAVAESGELERRVESHTETVRNEHALLLEEEVIVEASGAEEEAEDEDGFEDGWEEGFEEAPIGLARR